MPDSCAAWGCKNRRTIQSRYRGITFHKFPREKALRRQWEIATRRKGFSASDCSVLCSEHFKPRDVDRTGQIVRIREGAKPSVFSFPAHLQRPVAPRKTRTSRKAEERPPVDCSQQLQETKPVVNPTDLKARLGEALARVESLERDMRNVKKREQRAKNMVLALLEDLNGKNFINDELKHKLNFYSGKMKIKS
ncbi:THAP domain-containing protein 6-like [Sinocyclocheilus grahami]|uniref:THAP domain-containing protein 6-like n=1 Tax=Sinocyclocheilus grahami TaxID=75366 RepID=UPI0007ACB39E|nr:PREDICTED: THAP domain-containing protein 6-like [Sinocyclocheilus grahami]